MIFYQFKIKNKKILNNKKQNHNLFQLRNKTIYRLKLRNKKLNLMIIIRLFKDLNNLLLIILINNKIMIINSVIVNKLWVSVVKL